MDCEPWRSLRRSADPRPGDSNTSTPLAAKYNTTIKNVLDRVQPRIGFSWNPNAGTVIRGGYGIFTGLNQGKHLLRHAR